MAAQAAARLVHDPPGDRGGGPEGDRRRAGLVGPDRRVGVEAAVAADGEDPPRTVLVEPMRLGLRPLDVDPREPRVEQPPHGDAPDRPPLEVDEPESPGPSAGDGQVDRQLPRIGRGVDDAVGM